MVESCMSNRINNKIQYPVNKNTVSSKKKVPQRQKLYYAFIPSILHSSTYLHQSTDYTEELQK